MRIPVELRRAHRLLNHGPTTLVSSAHAGRRNVMAAAWAMPLDFDPPKVAVVIASDTFTRTLVDASGEFVLSLPTVDQLDLTYAVGSCSGQAGDKFERFGIATAAASKVAAPLVEGCAAWLECRRLPEPEVALRHDLMLAEVVAAWADDTLWVDGEWRFGDRPTLHHVARGTFHLTGERRIAQPI
jgi:flavin reductase (DIM6/NTAB) family NADH-FMN oxidoreductase RutF